MSPVQKMIIYNKNDTLQEQLENLRIMMKTGKNLPIEFFMEETYRLISNLVFRLNSLEKFIYESKPSDSKEIQS